MGMSAIGGPVDHWVYMKGDAVCINTTSSVDPCTNTIDMGQQTEKSFGIKNSEYLTVTDKNTTQMRVRRVAKSGAVGIADEKHLEVSALLDDDLDPMKSIIEAGELYELWSSVFVTVKTAPEEMIYFDKPQAKKSKHYSGKHILTHQGKISYSKISLCVSVSYKFSNETVAFQGSDCAVKKHVQLLACRSSYEVQNNKSFSTLEHCPTYLRTVLEHAAAQHV